MAGADSAYADRLLLLASGCSLRFPDRGVFRRSPKFQPFVPHRFLQSRFETIAGSREVKMKIESLEDLYLEQLQLLLDAETQVASVLPEMLEACTSEELRDALEEQLETAQEQAARLEKVLARATVQGIAARQTCTGMEGLVREAR